MRGGAGVRRRRAPGAPGAPGLGRRRRAVDLPSALGPGQRAGRTSVPGALRAVGCRGSCACQHCDQPSHGRVRAASFGIRPLRGLAGGARSACPSGLGNKFRHVQPRNSAGVDLQLRSSVVFLDVPNASFDDLPTHEIVAAAPQEILFEQESLLRKLRDTAALEERMRIARNLHDGVLQSLAGTALQLRSVLPLIESSPLEAARPIGIHPGRAGD